MKARYILAPKEVRRRTRLAWQDAADARPRIRRMGFARFLRSVAGEAKGRVYDARKLTVKQGRKELDVYLGVLERPDTRVLFGDSRIGAPTYRFFAMVTRPLKESIVWGGLAPDGNTGGVSAADVRFDGRGREQRLRITVDYLQPAGVWHSWPSNNILELPADAVIGLIKFSTRPGSQVAFAPVYEDVDGAVATLREVAKLIVDKETIGKRISDLPVTEEMRWGRVA